MRDFMCENASITILEYQIACNAYELFFLAFSGAAAFLQTKSTETFHSNIRHSNVYVY